ncbi:MAG: hypothetical protein IT303_01580 [Dehalococcoidia bacterium]|nr:hypothetical protein [Dehalococcoidia bacterium]
MLFPKAAWQGIADGSITLAFRRWAAPRAKAGSRHRTPYTLIAIDAVDLVDPGEITGAEAVAAGYASAEELLAGLRGEPGTPVYRVAFHAVAGDARAELASTVGLSPADVRALRARLARMDAQSEPWTAATLDAIQRRPGVRAADLAAELGRETLAFKRDVRKLKELGLTLSLEVGYRLSPRGEAYLVALPGKPGLTELPTKGQRE